MEQLSIQKVGIIKFFKYISICYEFSKIFFILIIKENKWTLIRFYFFQELSFVKVRNSYSLIALLKSNVVYEP